MLCIQHHGQHNHDTVNTPQEKTDIIRVFSVDGSDNVFMKGTHGETEAHTFPLGLERESD